ncbi:chromosomal replication initiator protein DnaA [Ruminococcus sp. OM05-10BH]|uniref:chromosomal replication initiator protein DnaA n=1 Tax=Drancourtella sp. An57 TaxID=1965647 RepID=UPI000B38A4F2|nr:chromosomal replication initiator protein DnaA [Drancourtella sp. An57]OUN67848.1 chromosomal replication initiator protein DnaA [Drancourtella sp. An57]RHV36675.1 chromosomal replication initiator protein DnaA [Ruminococcus sp. OM05-10BH]
MDIVTEKWNEIIENLRLEHSLSDVSFKTWILPLKVYDVIENTVYILVTLDGTGDYIDYIEKKYLLPFKVSIAEITGIEYDVKFIPDNPSELEKVEEIANAHKKKAAAHTKKNDNLLMIERANLNPRYTFDTFVVGKNNNFAHAASLAVAESPGEVYNPLFLYGGVGLGKTHLMHSIAHFILEKDPKKKVLYVTSEAFTNELIESLRSGKTGNELPMTAFRDKYRNVDVLLIDDIQFIIGKESTQEEFFHTFNHLHVAGKQIIISSDKPPKDIETLEARLRTRFEWGLIADISAPDYETRMAILKKKIESDQLERYHIPEDVLQFIATNIKSNIRELEGSLNKLIALYKLKNEEINISLAAEALKDLISPDENRKITPELIIETVSEHFGISVADLKSASRDAKTTSARHIAMYLCRSMTDTPLKMIGSLLGGRDHSTVKHGVDKVSKDMENNDSLKNTLSIIQKKISPL